MKAKILIVSVVTMLLLAMTLKLKSNKQTVDANIYRPDTDRKVLVEASRVEMKTLDKTFTYTGTFAPYREVLLTPQTHGQVEAIYFDEGDVVKAGALLVQIDDDLVQAQHMAAEANYETAKRNLQRYEKASLSGGVSKIQLDNLKLNVASAESERKQLEKQIELSRIEAPFSGTITLRDVEVGSLASAHPIARITELKKLKLEISVPEKEVVLFREGENAEIQTDIYPGQSIIGRIEHVADRADDSHNYRVRILIQNSDPSAALKAGMYGTALLNNGLKKEALTMPRTALLGSAKNPQVYLIADNRAVLTDIQIGQTIGEQVEVLKGLHAGDTVVTAGHINITTGSLVEVVK